MNHPLGDPYIVPADYPERKQELRADFASRKIVWVAPELVDAHVGDGYAFVESTISKRNRGGAFMRRIIVC